MSGPRLQRAATARQEMIQPVIAEQNFRVIQLAFDRKKVAGNGEPPGLHGILVYGHEPDAEFDIQGGREGHKKSNT